MKKIAVQTLTLHTNYGGILQAFALLKFLTNLGHDVVLLNSVAIFNEPNLTFAQNCRFKAWLYLTKDGRQKHKEKQLLKKTIKEFNDNFIDKYIKLSPPLHNYKEWADYIFDNNFDILIAGSDQVWRLDYNSSFRKECFLDYHLSAVKKISYAASLGVAEMDEKLKDCLLKYLPSFNAISVRETDSVNLLKEIGLKSNACLDPTLLLTKEDYISYLDLKLLKENFVFAYILDYDKEKYNFEQFVADPNTKIKFEEDFDASKALKNNLKKTSIIEWLQCIYSSQYVLTDSFHGVAFSIIFKKQFYVKINYKRGSSRFVSLLTQLDLMDRIWDGANIVKKEIDYDKVYEKLDRLKADSLEFLKRNLG